MLEASTELCWTSCASFGRVAGVPGWCVLEVLVGSRAVCSVFAGCAAEALRPGCLGPEAPCGLGRPWHLSLRASPRLRLGLGPLAAEILFKENTASRSLALLVRKS